MKLLSGCLALVAALPLVGNTAAAAGSVKLAAPIYQGAVPAVLADGAKVADIYTATFDGVVALDCDAHHAGNDYALQEDERNGFLAGPWCFLTRDPIDKVKAFYDKAIAPMHSIQGTWESGQPAGQGYAVYAERAWVEGEGGEEGGSAGFAYTGVSLHALPPPPAKPTSEAANTDDTWAGQEAYKFYAETRHFGPFVEAVDWFGDPSKRRPEELDALYRKRNRLESAFFQRKGIDAKPADEALRERYGKQQEQGMMQVYGGMVPSQAQIAQMRQAAQTPMPATQQSTPDDAEFNAFMKRNPEVAKKYVALTQKTMTLAQQGKFDEADAADEELQQLVDSNPELAAIERRADERSATIGAAAQAKEAQAAAARQGQMDQSQWGTWVQYLDAADKQAYYTLIVIDRAFHGDEKDYTRDPGVIAKETDGTAPHAQVFGFRYDDRPSQAAVAKPTSGTAAPASPLPSTDDLKGAAKEGLKALRKLF